MAEQQIGHQKSSLVLSARFSVVKCDDPVLLLNQPIVLYAKHRLSRTQDTNQTALRSAK